MIDYQTSTRCDVCNHRKIQTINDNGVNENRNNPNPKIQTSGNDQKL